MTAPPGFHTEHLRQQPRRLALRNVREIGDKRNRIAALVAGREISPTPVVAVDLERSELAIGAARIERDDLRADALASGEDARQHGREGRQRRPIDLSEVESGRSSEGPPEARQRGQDARKQRRRGANRRRKPRWPPDRLPNQQPMR